MNRHQCDHYCVLTHNIFSETQDQLFIKNYQKSQKEFDSEVENIVIFPCKKVITMTELNPSANALAIMGKRIYAVGDLNEIKTSLTLKKMTYQINDRYQDCYFYPGFIESHCHSSLEALYYHFHYVGAYKRTLSSGKKVNGFQTKKDIIFYLKKFSEAKESILFAWGYDPSVLAEKESVITADDLDQITSQKPVVIFNMSGHIAYANHCALADAGYSNQSNLTGLIKENGQLTGEIQELKALAPLLKNLQPDEAQLIEGFYAFASLARKRGVTTVTDLGLGLIPSAWQAMVKVTSQKDFPVRISNYLIHYVYQKLGGAKAYQEAKSNYENDKLTLSGVKVIADGSLQGYTAYMRAPYYYDRNTKGISNISLEHTVKLLQDLLKHDIQAAIHTNGDGAIEEILACIEHILRYTPDRDPRYRLEHCQTVTELQLEKMAKYQVLANFFINHVYYWGDFHKKHTLGPTRAQSINPLASAKKAHLKFALHSDAPITEIAPLRMIQNAINRQTVKGEVLGENERISCYDALKAVTKDAAFLLREEHQKGTLESGKLADITILEKNILEIPSTDISKTKVIATIVNGDIFDNE